MSSPPVPLSRRERGDTGVGGGEARWVDGSPAAPLVVFGTAGFEFNSSYGRRSFFRHL